MNAFGDDYTMVFTVVTELCRDVCIISKGFLFYFGDVVHSWHHLVLEENGKHSMEKEFNSLVEGNSLV
jgi:thiamine monophosphate kinase